jgi:hypothetical protein
MPARTVVTKNKERVTGTVGGSKQRRMNALPLDHFPSGELAKFPSGVTIVAILPNSSK